MSAEVVGRIIVRDFNLNLVTDGPRQPLSDPNSPAHGNLRWGGDCGALPLGHDGEYFVRWPRKPSHLPVMPI
jgi:hypothetical protein